MLRESALLATGTTLLVALAALLAAGSALATLLTALVALLLTAGSTLVALLATLRLTTVGLLTAGAALVALLAALLAAGSALLATLVALLAAGSTLGLATLAALVVSAAYGVASCFAALVNLVGEFSIGCAVSCVRCFVEALIGHLLSLFRVDGVFGLVCEIVESHDELLFSNVPPLPAASSTVLDNSWVEAREMKEYCVMLAQVSVPVHVPLRLTDISLLVFHQNYVSTR